MIGAEPRQRAATRSSHVEFAVAGREDEADFRRLLRESPMDGDVRITLEREPDFFAAAGIGGPREVALLGRDRRTGAAVGMGVRSVRPCFVNGEVQWLAYLGGLRAAGGLRGRRRALAGAYAFCRDLRRPDELPYCLTSIVADNHAARRLLERGLAGMPVYRPVAELCTLVLPAGRARRRPRGGASIRHADDADIPAVAECLNRNNRRRQFAPFWQCEDLRSSRLAANLRPGDFLLAEDGGRLVGCLAVWDQRPFKQAVVRGYSRRMRLLRPAVNLAAPLLGTVRLPRVGGRLESAFLSHVAVDGDLPEVLCDLIAAARADARRRAIPCVLLGLAAANPMLAAVRAAFRHRAYCSTLYLVIWPDGAEAADAVDGRPVHVEVATL